MREGQGSSLTVATAAISAQGYCKPCLTCERPFKSKNKKREFCSDRCRLLFWAVSTLVKEWKAGKANGLRDIIQKLRS
jgi:endogenous inhibitor of DNA gyrase (YacG/DUF329 family)